MESSDFYGHLPKMTAAEQVRFLSVFHFVSPL